MFLNLELMFLWRSTCRPPFPRYNFKVRVESIYGITSDYKMIFKVHSHLVFDKSKWTKIRPENKGEKACFLWKRIYCIGSVKIESSEVIWNYPTHICKTTLCPCPVRSLFLEIAKSTLHTIQFMLSLALITIALWTSNVKERQEFLVKGLRLKVTIRNNASNIEKLEGAKIVIDNVVIVDLYRLYC